MKRFLTLPLLLLLAVPAYADPPKVKTPAPASSPVILPQPPSPPVPPPSSTTRLPAGQLYVFRADVACQALCSPDGVVSISADTGPIKIHGTFVGGPGKPETITYKEKYVWTVEAASTGKCELIIIPTGSDIVRVSLDVDNGPTPPKPPDPPGPPTDALTKALSDAYALEADPKKADKLAALGDYYGAVIAAAKLDPSVTTLGTLQVKVHAGADLVTGAGGMPTLRKAVAAYVAPKLPTSDQPLTPALWTTVASAYGDVSKALKGVKP